MISTPPDAIGVTKPARQSDTSESSDDDQPTPAKKMKHDDTKSNCYFKMRHIRLCIQIFLYNFLYYVNI